MSRQSASAALAVVLMAACESTPTPSEPSQQQSAIASRPAAVAKPNPSFQPFAFAVDNCVETVDLTGTFHGVTQFFVGPGGKEHARFHINAKGTGVGRLTGSRTSGTTGCSTSPTSPRRGAGPSRRMTTPV